jgi:hypothetical protein
MRNTTRLAALVIALGLVAMTVSACGNGFAKMPVDDILTATQKATATTSFVHVTGRVTRKDRSYLVDLHVARSGACRGTIARQGARIEVLVVEERTFFRGDPALLEETGLATRRQAKVLDRPRSLWLEGGLSPFRSACDMDALLGTVDAQEWVEDGAGGVEVERTREIAGVGVVRLSSERDGTNDRMFVTTADPHHVVRLVSRGSLDGSSRLSFTDYDIPVGTLLPDKSDIVKLHRGKG